MKEDLYLVLMPIELFESAKPSQELQCHYENNVCSGANTKLSFSAMCKPLAPKIIFPTNN